MQAMRDRQINHLNSAFRYTDRLFEWLIDKVIRERTNAQVTAEQTDDRLKLKVTDRSSSDTPQVMLAGAVQNRLRMVSVPRPQR